MRESLSPGSRQLARLFVTQAAAPAHRAMIDPGVSMTRRDQSGGSTGSVLKRELIAGITRQEGSDPAPRCALDPSRARDVFVFTARLTREEGFGRSFHGSGRTPAAADTISSPTTE